MENTDAPAGEKVVISEVWQKKFDLMEKGCRHFLGGISGQPDIRRDWAAADFDGQLCDQYRLRSSCQPRLLPVRHTRKNDVGTPRFS